jgi:FAD/FMN-containing dehydrogenase
MSYADTVTGPRPKAPTHDVLEGFRTIVGPKGYCDDPDTLKPWLVDWRGLYSGKTPVMLSPATVSELQQIVSLAARTNTALVPQGGNTSMVGGATPPEDGHAILVSLRRLDKVRALDGANHYAIVEAGVILETLHEAALAKQVRFPLTLGAKGSATIGGLVSTNAGGTQVLRFGTMRRLVQGLEAVLPDGSLFSDLAGLKKDNRGYDLSQLLIGAEGTLGFVTAARLHLVDAITDNAVAWVGTRSPHDALAMLRAMEAKSGTSIESFEIVPDPSLQLVCTHIAGARSPFSSAYPWNVLVELVSSPSSSATARATLQDLLETELNSGRALDAVIAANDAQAKAFWRLRDCVSEAERASGPAIQHDIAVAVEAMPDFMCDAAKQIEAEFPGVKASAFGHLGDGNVHFHVRAPEGIDPATWRAGQGKAASDRVYELVMLAGGSISAEHGIGQMKRATFAKTIDAARLGALLAIKHALDPQGLMNSGKLLPLASDG